MEIGMIGLGRMGGNMAERLLRGGHRVVAYDPNEAAVEASVQQGVTGASWSCREAWRVPNSKSFQWSRTVCQDVSSVGNLDGTCCKRIRF